MMTGDLILLGHSGQVATAVAAAAAAQGRTIRQLARSELDLARPSEIAARLAPILKAASPGSVLVNAAAYTDVNRAESEPDLAETINTLAPGMLAASCQRAGVAIIHLSTDYVYDGLRQAPYRESDVCNPASVYGRTKLGGDEAVMLSGANHVIVRTSAVYSASGQNFVRTMLRLGASQDPIRVVDDQITCPTAAADIAQTILAIANRLAGNSAPNGVFHYCGDTPRSWADFATEIFATFEPDPDKRPAVVRIATADYPTPAKRPPNSVLDCGAIRQSFGITQPHHATALERAIASLTSAL